MPKNGKAKLAVSTPYPYQSCDLVFLLCLCVDSLKSELEKLEEEAMINELVELVERRDELLWALHFEKGR